MAKIAIDQERSDSVAAGVDAIVATRCDLEQKCSNIAPGQKYNSREACESKLQGTTAAELNIQDCPRGVDCGKLEACLATIRAEECSSVFDSMSRWNACRTGTICIH